MPISPEFAAPPADADPPALTLDAVAARLEVAPAQVRQWLTLFHGERRYDATGHLWLSARDAEFLRLVKSLRDVDRSCASIARLLGADPEVGPLRLVAEAEADADLPPGEPDDAPEAEAADAGDSDIAQIETLKAELRDLHARPAKKPFWKFWDRR